MMMIAEFMIFGILAFMTINVFCKMNNYIINKRNRQMMNITGKMKNVNFIQSGRGRKTLIVDGVDLSNSTIEQISDYDEHVVINKS